jgi:hypothetical protein
MYGNNSDNYKIELIMESRNNTIEVGITIRYKF